MKAYTDLSQSKKLAEILPLESADMYYDRGGLPSLIDKYVTHESIKNDKYHHLIPCWSLAALIDALPDKVLIDGHFWSLSIGRRGISYLGYMTYDGQLHLSVENDNLIDACVDMILKLKEMNLL